MANEQQLVLADMMTGRHNMLVRLLQGLRRDPEVFGDPVPGTGDEPGVVLSGVHYLRKVVARLPNPRPARYFNVTEGGGIGRYRRASSGSGAAREDPDCARRDVASRGPWVPASPRPTRIS
jgi:hypothetical protein